MVSSDPPYYDNIGYADLSDFFYVWLRRSLKDTYPKIFNTLLVPKKEELIVAPYRNDGLDNAVRFFEDGMLEACKKFYLYAHDDFPITIYYAYKQKDSEETNGSDERVQASSGWEKMLTSIINAGLSITMTHPMRTELGNRTNSLGANALASSIVIVCRKRTHDAEAISRREFMNDLRRELRPALKNSPTRTSPPSTWPNARSAPAWLSTRATPPCSTTTDAR